MVSVLVLVLPDVPVVVLSPPVLPPVSDVPLVPVVPLSGGGVVLVVVVLVVVLLLVVQVDGLHHTVLCSTTG